MAQTQAAAPNAIPAYRGCQSATSVAEAAIPLEKASAAQPVNGAACAPPTAAGQDTTVNEAAQIFAPLLRSVPSHVSAPPTTLPAVADLGSAALTWQLSSVRGFYGISGAYDITELVGVLDKRGLHRCSLLCATVRESQVNDRLAVFETPSRPATETI